MGFGGIPGTDVSTCAQSAYLADFPLDLAEFILFSCKIIGVVA